MRRIIPLVVLGLACARAAGAQVYLPLPEGARVRVQTHTSNPQVGTVDGLTDDTLFFRSERTGQVQALGVTRLRRVEVSEGKGSRLRSTAIGMAAGLGAGVVMSGAFGRGCDTALSPSRSTCSGGRQTLSIALEVGALGAVLGAVLPIHERWRTVLSPHAASVSLSPTRRAIGVPSAAERPRGRPPRRRRRAARRDRNRPDRARPRRPTARRPFVPRPAGG